MSLIWLCRGNLSRATESLIIAAQNNVISTNHDKAKTGKMLDFSKCWLCSERDITVNPIISKNRKLTKKSVQEELQFGREVDPRGIVQMTEV